MRIILLLVLLAFPVMDVMLTTRIAERFNVSPMLLMVPGFIAGIFLLRREGRQFKTQTLSAIIAPSGLQLALQGSARRVLAGVFLLIPGVISDVIGLLLFIFAPSFGSTPETASQVLDGQFRRVD